MNRDKGSAIRAACKALKDGRSGVEAFAAAVANCTKAVTEFASALALLRYYEHAVRVARRQLLHEKKRRPRRVNGRLRPRAKR